MGTEYRILKKPDSLDVVLDESSNVFSLQMSGAKLRVFPKEEIAHASADGPFDLTPDDVIKMALEMLKVASYWCDSDDFDKAVRDWRGSEVSYEATMLRSIGKVGAE
jgi:hypothetical protein